MHFRYVSGPFYVNDAATALHISRFAMSSNGAPYSLLRSVRGADGVPRTVVLLFRSVALFLYCDLCSHATWCVVGRSVRIMQ